MQRLCQVVHHTHNSKLVISLEFFLSGLPGYAYQQHFEAPRYHIML